MKEPAWSPQWSPDVEKAWAATLQSDADPRASIRAQRPATIASDDSRTRPLDSTEADEMRGVEVEARPRRQIAITAPGAEGRLGETEFELVDELGAGGMGTVFRARQTSLDREVALKQLTDTETMPNAVAHFESEASITAVLEHPAIVPVYDMGASQAGDVFYTMKLVQGVPWNELLDPRIPGEVTAPAGGKHDLRAHLEILVEVSNAVAYAHSRNIIHRDIKPQNIMVGDFGEVLLVDWGLACALGPMPAAPRIFDLDQVLITCGTPTYMPPEISTGMREWVGPWTDVFMLGAVLFEVLYGLPPREEATAIDMLKVASKNEWHFPNTIGPKVQPYHDVLAPIVTRALATHPKERFADGRAFSDAMREALTHLDAAELAAEAIADFATIEAAHGQRQTTRRGGLTQTPAETRQAQYRKLGKVHAVLEQSLSSWPANPSAQHYIVEAQLLHGLIALENNELSLARQQLEGLDHLPSNVVPRADQHKRAKKLRTRLGKRVADRARRRRRTTMVWIGAAVLTVALVVGSAAAAFLIRGARDQARVERNHLSRLLIASASDGVEAELQGLLQPVRGSLLAAADWSRAGRLDTTDPAVLSSFFVPLIDGHPVISAIVRADDQGHQYVLLRKDAGWEVRVTTPGKPTEVRTLDARGRLLETSSEEIEYDPRTRPWYVGAIEAGNVDPAGDVPVAWTEPYLFFTAQQPGITASVRVTTPARSNYVLGVDMLLTDLSTFTMRMPDLEHGKVFVLDTNDRVIGLPRHAGFESEAAKIKAVLSPLPELGEPVSAGALAAWEARDRALARPFRYEAAGEAWWTGFRRFELSQERVLVIGVVLPEANFEALEPVAPG